MKKGEELKRESIFIASMNEEILLITHKNFIHPTKTIKVLLNNETYYWKNSYILITEEHF